MKLQILATALLLSFGQLGIRHPATAEESHGHKHDASVFVGGTHTDHDDGFTIGLEYEFRFHQKIGVGVSGEYASLAHDTWVVGMGFVLHPYRGLKFVAMPGAEITNEHEEFLFRLGIGYDIPAGDWAISPRFNVDFVDGEENLVFGITLGKAF
jgi:hypothetical protein